MSELNQSFDTWSKSSTETDPVKQLKSFAGYVRAEHFKNGTYNDEVEEGIRQGVGKSLYSRNILREDSTEEEKQAVEQTLGAPDDTFDADAQFVYNQITGYAKEEDLLDQDQADVIRRYVSSRRLGLNEQADSYKDRVADIIKDPYITTKSKLGALNRGEVPVVAIVDKDGNRSLKAGPNWSEDTVRKSVDDLVSRGAIGSDDLRGVNYLLQTSAFGTSSNADVERSNEFFGDVDLLAGSDENFSGAVDAINEKRKEDEDEADKGFFGKLWDTAAEVTGNLFSAAKDSVVYNVGEAKKGSLVAPLGSLGAVKEGIERRGEAENANALKQRTDIAAIIASSPIGSKYSAEEIERFSNDFVTLRSQPNYNPDKPETGIRLMSTGVPILSPAIIARKQELDKAIAATGLNAAQENVARVAATKTLEAQAPEMIRLVTSRDTDAVTAYAKAKEKGQSDADFISEWVGNDDNYDNFRNRLSSTAYSTLTGIASLAVAAPALFGNKDAAETLVGMSKGAESYSRYAEMFGDKFGVGQDIANMLPQIAIDVALSTVSGGTYAIAKAGLGAAARGAAASVVKREVASLATRTAKNMMVGMSKEAAESVALAATKSEFTGSALRSVANNISTFASSKGGYLNNLAAVGPSTFLRSAGGTYSSIYSQLPESMSHEEKHQKAFGSAIAAGSFTALLTAGMSTLGAGGVESLATRDLEELTFNQVRKLYSTTRAMSSKIADKTIKEEIRKATSGAVKQFLVSGAREGGGEAFEEGVDQAFQMMVEDAALNRDTPIAEIGKNIWYAAGLGGLMGVGFNVAPQLAPTLTQKGKLNEDRKIMSARLQLFGEISGKLTDAGAPKTAEALAAVIAESNLPKETPADTAVTPEAIAELETVDWDPVSDPTTGLLADYEFSTAYFDGNGGKVMRDGAGNMILEFFKPLKTGETSVVLGDPADKASGRIERKSRIKVTKNEEGQIKAGSPVVKRGTINYALPHASYRPATKVSYNKKGKAVGLTVFRAKSIGGDSTMDIHITQEDALVETARYYGISLEPRTTEQVEAEKNTPPIEGSSKLNKERKDKQKAQIKEQRKQDATAAAEVNKTTTTKKRGKKAAATEDAPAAEAEIDVVAEPDGELPEVETVTNKGRSKIAEKILTSAGIEPSTASVVGDYIAKKVDPAGNMPTEEFRDKVSDAFRAMGGSVKGDAAEYSENADDYLEVDTYGRTPAEQAEAAKAFNAKVNTDRLQKNRAIAHLIVKGGEPLDVDKGVLTPSQSTILDPEIDFDYANLGQEELEQVISNLELAVETNPESVDLAEELEEATRVYNMIYVDEEDEGTSDFVEIPEEQRSSVMKALRSGAVTTVKFQYKGTVREGVVEDVEKRARTKVTIGFDGISTTVNVSQIDFTPFISIVNEEPEIEKEAPSPQSLKFAGVTLGTGTEALTPSEAAWVSEDPAIREYLLSPQFSKLFSKNIIKDGSKRQYILENMREMATKEGAAATDMAPVRIMGSQWFADIELAPADVSITPINAEGTTEDEAGATEDEVDTRTVSDITKTLQRIIKPLLELKQKMDRWTSDMDNPRSRKSYARNKDKYEQLLKSTETRYSNEMAALENAEQGVDSFDVATSFALSQLDDYVAKADTAMAEALERAAEKERNKKVPSIVDYSTRDKWDKFRTEEERQAFDLLVAHGYPVTDFRRIFNPKGIDEANPNSYMLGKRLYLRELIQEKYPTFNVPTTIEEYKAFNQSDYIKWTNAEGASVKAPIVSETITDRDGKKTQSMVFTNDPAITMAQLEAGGTAGIFVDDKYLGKLNPSINVVNGFVTDVEPPYEQNQGQNATSASSNLNNIMDALDISSAFQEIPQAYVKVINPTSSNAEDLFNSLWVNTRDFLASSKTLRVGDEQQRINIINDTVVGYTAALRMFVLSSRVSDLVARSIQFKGKVGNWNYAVASQDKDGTLFLSVDPEQQTNFITNRKALKEAVSEMSEAQLRGILDAKAMSNFLVKADSIEGETKEETLAREKVILERASNSIENTFPHLSKGMKFTGEVRHRAILSNFGMFMLQKSLGLKLFVPDADFTSRYSDFTSPPDLGKILTEVHGRHRTKKSNVASQVPSTSFDALLTASEEGSFTLEANLREDFDTFSSKLDRMSDILGAASSEDVEYSYANTEDSLTAAAEGDPMIRALLVDLVNKLDPTTVINDESSVSSVISALLYNVNIAGKVSGNTSYGFGAKLLVMGDAVKNLSTSTEGRKLAAYMYYLGWLPDRAQFEGMDQAPSVKDVQARLETLPITRGTLRPPTKQETKKGPNELDFINDYYDSVVKITTSEEGAGIRRLIQREADHRKALTTAENFLKLAVKQRGSVRIIITEDARNLIKGLQEQISHIEDRKGGLSNSIRSLNSFIANADNQEFRNRNKEYANMTVIEAQVRVSALNIELDELLEMRKHKEGQIDIISGVHPLTRKVNHFKRVVESLQKGVKFYSVRKHLTEFYQGATVTPIPEPELGAPKPQPVRGYNTRTIRFGEATVADLRQTIATLEAELPKLVNEQKKAVQDMSTKGSKLGAKLQKASEVLGEAQVAFNESKQAAAPTKKAATKEVNALKKAEARTQKAAEALLSFDNKVADLKSQLARSMSLDEVASGTALDKHPTVVASNKAIQNRDSAMANIRSIRDDIRGIRDTTDAFREDRAILIVELNNPRKKPAAKRKSEIKKEIKQLSDAEYENDALIAAKELEIQTVSKSLEGLRQKAVDLEIERRKLDVPDVVSAKTIKLREQITEAEGSRVPLADEAALAESEAQYTRDSVAMATTVSLQEVDTAAASVEATARLEKAQADYQAIQDQLTPIETRAVEARSNLNALQTKLNMMRVELSTRTTGRNIRASLSDTAVRLIDERIRINTQEAQEMGLNESTEKALRHIAKNGAPHLRIMANLLLSNLDIVSQIRVSMTNIDPQVAGLYINDTLVILNMAGHNGRGLGDVLIHELTHALTVNALKDPKIAKRIESLRILAKRKFTEAGFPVDDAFYRHAFSDNEEFLSAVFTDKHVQDILRNVEVAGGRSWLQRIWDAITSIFGNRSKQVNTALDELIRFVDMSAMTYGSRSASIKQRSAVDAADAAYDRARIRLNNKTMDLIESMAGGDMNLRFAGNALTGADYARHADLESRKGSLTPDELAEAQALVDKAARGVGFDTEAWHYTSSPEQFTEFDSSMAGDFGGWFYFSPKNVNRSGKSNSRLAGKFFLNLGNTLIKPSYETVAGVGTPNSYITEADTDGYDSITGTEQGLGGVEVAEYITKSPAQIKSAEPFTGVPLQERFSPMSNDIRYSLSEEPVTLESRIRNILPAGFNLVEDTFITQPFGVKGSTIMFNPEVAARSVEDADPELQDQILSTLIKHEVAHVAANAVMKPEDYDAVAEGLGSDIMDKVASDYYRAAYPDVAERKRVIEEDRSSGQLTDRVLAAEWFRSKVEKAVNGKSTEEVIRELKGNKTLIGTFLKYFQEFLAILRGGQKDSFSLGVAADISKASRIYEDLLNNGIPKAEPEPQEGVGHTAELIEAIRTGQGNQAFFVQPIAFADKKNTTVETVWGRISKLIRNLPADINKLVRDREGDIRAAQFLMERFAPHYKRFLEPALKAGADINDVGMILGTTAPTMDDAAVARVDVVVEAFSKTIASGTPVDEVDKLVSAEKTRALAAEKKIQDTAFLNNQKAATARMDAIAPEFSKFLQTFRKEIDKRQDAIGYSHSAGIYLTRTYKFFNTEGWASAARDADGATYRLNGEEINFGDLRAKAAQSYEADVIAEYAAEGVTLTPSLLTRGVQDKLDSLLKWLSENATVDKGETLSQDLRRFMPKNNVDSAVRELLGETKNPMENALRTLHYVAVLDANKKALTAIKDSLVQSGLGSDTEKVGFVQVFGTGVTKSREPLGGLFVRADIAKELEAEFGSNARKLMKHTEGVLNKVTGGLAKMSGAAMTTKTLMSIGFYTRNILSNQVVLIAAQGIVPLASSGLDLYKSYRLSGIANFESRGKDATEAELAEIQELIRLGILRDSSSRGQFEDLMRGYADRAGVTFETAMDDIIKVASKGDLNALQNMASRAYGGLKGSVEFLAAVNSWFDDASKAQVYFFEKNELAKAYPSNTAEWHSEQAATKVKLTMPSHSEQLDIVRSFNRNPLSLFVFPFARWKTEVLRTYVNTQKLAYREITSGNSRMFVRGLRRGMGSAVVTYAGMTVLNGVLAAAFRLLTGQDDEEDKDKDKNAVVVDDPAVLSALRVAFPEYQKGHSLRVTTNGRELSVIDMTAIHPYATLIDSATIIREGLATGKGVDTKKLASYFASQFVGSQIASGAVLDIVNNQNDFGQKIYEETDDSLVQVRKMITYVGAQAYKPGIVAKIQASTRKGEANPDYIWAGEFLGARPKVYTLDQVARAGFYSLKSESDSIKRQRSALSSGRAISEEDVRDIMVTTQEADDRTQARLHQFMNAMRSVGTSERVIVQRAVATGMSKKRVAEAIEGRNTTWMGSADWAKGMVDNVTQTGEDDPRARFDMIGKVYKSMPPETSVRNIK